jgi:Holliday junction DNA helicase RuvA
MIARLRGRPVAHDADGLVVEVGGVGYRLLATQSAVRKAEGQDEVVLETHLHVREDALQLFGFATADERTLFEQLLAVTGVEAKMALAIVSAYAPGEIRRAIVTEDTALFQSIPGIGEAGQRVCSTEERIAPLPVRGAAPRARRRARGRARRPSSSATRPEAEQRLDTDPRPPPAERVRAWPGALRAA